METAPKRRGRPPKSAAQGLPEIISGFFKGTDKPTATKKFRPSKVSKVRSFRIPNEIDSAIEDYKIPVTDVCHSAILKELKAHMAPDKYKSLTQSIRRDD